MKMRSKKINIYFDTVYHTTEHYTAQLHSPFAITTSGFYFRNWTGIWYSMKTLPAIKKMLLLPADFSSRPVGRALLEE